MRKTFIFVLLSFFTALSFAKPQKEKPAWIDNLNTIYPDSLYIAKLGKAQGAAKSNAVLAQENADNNVAEYLNVTIQSQTVSKTNYETKIEAGKLSTSETKDNSRIIQTSVNMTLSGLSHTDAWYNKKEKTWYCAAYVSRDKAYEAYKPTVTDGRNKFLALYEKAEAEKEPLFQCNYYKTAYNASDDFINAYNFANLLKPSAVKDDFEKDREKYNRIPSVVKSIIIKCSMYITVKNDYGSSINSALLNTFSQMGFLVQEGNALYKVEAVVNDNDSVYKMKSKETHSIYPSIDLVIRNKEKMPVYSFSYKTEEKTTNFSLESAQRMAFPKFAEEMKNALKADFESKLGINELDLLFGGQ